MEKYSKLPPDSNSNYHFASIMEFLVICVERMAIYARILTISKAPVRYADVEGILALLTRQPLDVSLQLLPFFRHELQWKTGYF